MSDWRGFRLKTREENSELRERFVVYSEDEMIPREMPDDSSGATLFVHSKRWEYRPSPSLEVERDGEPVEEYGLPVSLLKHIVCAVNCHEQFVSLLADLRDALAYADGDFGPDKQDQALIDQADMLLAKVKGES